MPPNAVSGLNTAAKGWMGVTVDTGGGGAVVQYLMPGAPAQLTGIAVNDVIVGINGHPIRNSDDFHTAISATAAGQTIKVKLLRDATTRYLAVKLGKSPL